MKYKVCFIVMLLIIGKYEISIGGNKSKVESKKSHQNFILPKSFDTSITVLPKEYKGDDIVSMYNYLSNKYPSKDEYETKEAFESRINSNIPKAIFAFVRDRVDGIRWSKERLEYNPETETMTIDIPEDISGRGIDKREIIKIKRIGNTRKDLIGKNIFGGEVNGSFYKADDYGVCTDSNRKIRIKENPEEARVLKQDYGLLLICKISPNMKTETAIRGVTGKGLDTKAATMDWPTLIVVRNHFIFVSIMEIWVFNKKTGYIYFKDKLYSDEISDNKKINE